MKEYVFWEEFEPLYFYSGSSQNWGMGGFHFHKNYEIILFMGDNATINIENRVYAVEKGDLFLLNDSEYHKTVGERDAPYRRYVLMFDPCLFRQLREVLRYDFLVFFENRPENFIHKVNLSGSNLMQVIKIFDEIGALHSISGDSASQATITLRIVDLLMLVQNMFSFFSRNVKPGTFCEMTNITFASPEKSKDRIAGIKEYIENHIDQPLGLEELANRFFVNKHYLSHYFKKETGFSISEYIKNQKVSAAKRLLKNGLTVTQTALALGFNSDSYFIGVFKQMTGTTPKKYVMEKKNPNKNGG